MTFHVTFVNCIENYCISVKQIVIADLIQLYHSNHVIDNRRENKILLSG